MARELHLSASLDGAAETGAGVGTGAETGIGTGNGNRTGNRAGTGTGPRPGPGADDPGGYWSGLVRLAERGTLDFVTLHDSFAPPSDGEPGGRLEAVAVFARTAPESTSVGLVPTVTTTHTEPFHTSTSVATLDFVSEGRAGWLVGVSTGEAEARAFGRRGPSAPSDLWSEAGDAAEVAGRLWDSWQDDAEIRDAATGRFIDRDRLHYIDFEGPHFSVRGPSIVPRPPQGRPPVAVGLDPGDTEERWALATHHADVVLLDAEHPEAARHARTLLRERAAAAGRDPDALRVLVRVTLDLADSGNGDDGTPETGTRPGTGTDPGTDPDPTPGKSTSTSTSTSRAPRRTVHFGGAPGGLASLLAEWHASGAADGFHLLPVSPTGDLAKVVDEVVPLLRERGLFRSRYTGRTLRDHLGLSRPASRYAPEVTR